LATANQRVDVRTCSLTRFNEQELQTAEDLLAVEEPLEIQVALMRDGVCMIHPVAVTMRTPGDDLELAVGFLYTEQVIASQSWIQHVDHARDEHGERLCNRVRVTLEANVPFDLEKLSRHIFTSSSCGICGKQTIERVRAQLVADGSIAAPLLSERLRGLPEQLAAHQFNFRQTGGLHASALFDLEGRLRHLREDVGRHNALDKVIGRLFLDDQLPARDTILLLSGRASFELVQKAILAGIPHIAAIGPPSSLAVDLAREFGTTLIGFLRAQRFNVYSGTVL
jgi:FdhD protein